MPALSFGSAEELEAKRKQYPNLPEEEYILEVKDITIQKDKTSFYDTEKHDELMIGFNVISFKDGEPAYYEDGTEPDAGEAIRLVDWINPEKQGLFPRIAKARQFLAAALGLPVEGQLVLESYEDLVGSRLIGNVVHKTTPPKVAGGKAIVRDRIDGYRALKSRPPRRGPAGAPAAAPNRAPKSDEEVQAEAESVLARGIEIFGDDEAPF